MIDDDSDLRRAMARCPLIAVLRGVRPDEVEAVADILVEQGFTMIEVPLNSPDPIDSIERLARRYGDAVLIGAGTILQSAEVAQVAKAGGRLAISPSTDPAVIADARAAGLISIPGFFTPSEAFAALRAGAHGLKLFPAEGASPAMLRAQRAILPPAAPVFAVGGITPDAIPAWRTAGADGFGLGSNLYHVGKPLARIAEDAAAFVRAARI